MGRKDELEARVRETPLSERLDDCRTRIGRMCSEGRPPRMTIPVQYDDDDFYISTTLSDAQATIADLQGQVKLANIDQANVEAERNDLQQRVAQLEGERDMYKRSSDTFAECVDNVREAMGLETTHYLVLPDDVADLKADHARVLGLVRDFVAAWDHDGEPDAMSYETAVDKARPYLASLPAPPAQGARCDQCGTRLAHEDHKYDCPYMIVKRQHAEGETRA